MTSPGIGISWTRVHAVIVLPHRFYPKPLPALGGMGAANLTRTARTCLGGTQPSSCEPASTIDRPWRRVDHVALASVAECVTFMLVMIILVVFLIVFSRTVSRLLPCVASTTGIAGP